MATANQFTLKGHSIEVEYTSGATPGTPVLHYKDACVSLDFKQDEIRTDPTALGLLVSMRLEGSVDVGGTVFAFFLPSVDVPSDETFYFTTVALREESTGPNSIPQRAATWHPLVIHGTAKSEIVRL